MIRPRTLAAALAAMVASSAAGAADDFRWGEGHNQRFRASIGAFWAQPDTRIRLDRSDGTANAKIDFEDTLGLSDSETMAWVDLRLRLARRHLLDLSYYELERSGSRTLSVNVDFGDESFTASTQVDSYFDTRIARLAYGYSILNNDTRELGVLLGLHLTRIEVGIRDVGLTGQVETAEGTAPLPTFGLHGALELPWRWRFRGWGQIFALQLDDFEGRMTNGAVVFEHDTFRNLGFGFGYNFFGIDLESEDPDIRGEFEYDFDGPMAYVNLMF